MEFQAAGEASGSGVPLWLQIVGAVVVILTGILGLPAATRAGRKVGLENRKIQLEIQKLENEAKAGQGIRQGITREGPAATAPHATLAGIEGFVARFIILFITTAGWNVVSAVVSPVLNIGLSTFAFSGLLEQNFLSVVISYFYAAGDIYIFATLGLPLLKDVLASQGLSVQSVLRQQPR